MKDNKKMLTILFWLPRGLSILFIAFLAIFALDVFIPGKTFGYYAIGLFMHLIPNFILIVFLLIAWKEEQIGGILFILTGIFFTLFFHTYEFIINFLLISLPLFLIGIVFLLHRAYQRGKINVVK